MLRPSHIRLLPELNGNKSQVEKKLEQAQHGHMSKYRHPRGGSGKDGERSNVLMVSSGLHWVPAARAPLSGRKEGSPSLGTVAPPRSAQ